MLFINPIFLFGLAAAALPVLYHLVRRMKAKQVPFGSIRFLKATPKEVVRKRRLRDVLLMAMRMAIFALLAFVFARPFIPQEHLPFVPQQERRSTVLLLDRSMSMQHAGAFDAALREARARLDAAGPGDEFAVVVFDDQARLLTELGTDAALHRGSLDAATPGYRRTDFYQALRLADEILRSARHEARSIVLVSDFQSAGWGGSLENWKLGPGVTLETVDVGAARAENAYVEAFHLSQRRAGQQVALRFDARIATHGELAGREHLAMLSVGSEPVGRQALPARSSRPVTFQQVAPREGTFQGTLALDADALPADDRYFFTYRVAPRPSILVVDEAPGGQRDAFFLRHAFDLGDEGLYTFAAGGPERLAPGTLRAHQVVFVANVRALSAAQAAALRDYVEAGGTLIVSFGERVDVAAFSETLRTLGVGRLDGRVDARAMQGYEAIIGEVDLRHPIFNLFSGDAAGAILRPRFRHYVRALPDSGTVVLGAFDSGDPFLLERRLGRGKVLVYAATFNTDWTDFPVNELFVPFVYQLVKYGLQGADALQQYAVGDVVPLRGRPGETWEVRAPGNRVYRVQLDEQGNGFFRETEEPGHYLAAGGREPFAFSVNVDPRESNLARRDPVELYAAVTPPPAHVANTPEQAVALAVEDAEQKQKLWRYLLLLVVALFAFETYYANRRVVKRDSVERGFVGRGAPARYARSGVGRRDS